jgi:cytochrome c
MDGFEFNKIAGAVLATLLIVLGLKNSPASFITAKHRKNPATQLKLPKPAPAARPRRRPVPAVSLGTLLASADPAKGAATAKACMACHDFTKGGPNKTGPNLFDVVERGIASHEGLPIPRE